MCLIFVQRHFCIYLEMTGFCRSLRCYESPPSEDQGRVRHSIRHQPPRPLPPHGAPPAQDQGVGETRISPKNRHPVQHGTRTGKTVQDFPPISLGKQLKMPSVSWFRLQWIGTTWIGTGPISTRGLPIANPSWQTWCIAKNWPDGWPGKGSQSIVFIQGLWTQTSSSKFTWMKYSVPASYYLLHRVKSEFSCVYKIVLTKSRVLHFKQEFGDQFVSEIYWSVFKTHDQDSFPRCSNHAILHSRRIHWEGKREILQRLQRDAASQEGTRSWGLEETLGHKRRNGRNNLKIVLRI